MYVKVINPKRDGKKGYNNAGSCTTLVNYLSKEDQGKGLDRELYFTHDRDMVGSMEVIKAIDNNCPKIEKHEAKFYSLVIAPRPDEMNHLKNDREKLKAYVRDVMDIYAKNFNGKNGNNKNLKGNDIVYFAKLEENRYYKGTDKEVKEGKAKQGDPLPGDNTHIHVVVSRMDKTKTVKLSPLVNSKKLFHREAFKTKSCEHFDNHYRYIGSGKELEKHIVMRDGTIEQRKEYILREYEQRKAQREQQEEKQTVLNTQPDQQKAQEQAQDQPQQQKPKMGM